MNTESWNSFCAKSSLWLRDLSINATPNVRNAISVLISNIRTAKDPASQAAVVADLRHLIQMNQQKRRRVDDDDEDDEEEENNNNNNNNNNRIHNNNNRYRRQDDYVDGSEYDDEDDEDDDDIEEQDDSSDEAWNGDDNINNIHRRGSNNSNTGRRKNAAPPPPPVVAAPAAKRGGKASAAAGTKRKRNTKQAAAAAVMEDNGDPFRTTSATSTTTVLPSSVAGDNPTRTSSLASISSATGGGAEAMAASTSTAAQMAASTALILAAAAANGVDVPGIQTALREPFTVSCVSFQGTFSAAGPVRMDLETVAKLFAPQGGHFPSVPVTLGGGRSGSLQVAEVTTLRKNKTTSNFIVLKFSLEGLKLSLKLYSSRYFQLFGASDRPGLTAREACNAVVEFIEQRAMSARDPMLGRVNTVDIMGLSAHHNGLSENGFGINLEALRDGLAREQEQLSSNSRTGALVLKSKGNRGSWFFHAKGSVQLYGTKLKAEEAGMIFTDMMLRHINCVRAAGNAASANTAAHRRAVAAAAAAAAAIKANKRRAAGLPVEEEYLPHHQFNNAQQHQQQQHQQHRTGSDVNIFSPVAQAANAAAQAAAQAAASAAAVNLQRHMPGATAIVQATATVNTENNNHDNERLHLNQQQQEFEQQAADFHAAATVLAGGNNNNNNNLNNSLNNNSFMNGSLNSSSGNTDFNGLMGLEPNPLLNIPIRVLRSSSLRFFGLV